MLGEDFIDVGKRVKEEGLSRLKKIHSYYFQCLKLVDTIEDQKYKAEQLKGRDLVIRNKHAKRTAKTIKRINQLFGVINQSFLRGELKDFEGKAFAVAIQQSLKEGVSSISRPTCATCHIQRLEPMAGTTSEARKALSQLDKLVLLYEDYEKKRQALDKRIKGLKGDIHNIENKMRELQKVSETLKEIKDSDKLIKDYEQLGQLLENYESIRRKRLSLLATKPVPDLVKAFYSDKKSGEIGFPIPNDEKALKELSAVASHDCPNFSAGQLLECLTYNDKKLSHMTPEPTKLKQLVLDNHNWLSSVDGLPNSDFLKLTMESSKADVEKAGEFLRVDKELIDEIKNLVETVDAKEAVRAKSLILKSKQESMSQLREKWESASKELANLLKIKQNYF
ncbi:MAG: hypothetical protein J7L23_00790 [Candidatus Diapherotrites archaeon]|nr:hypothetical protein [Candidatus Diapherotrites archaeon]